MMLLALLLAQARPMNLNQQPIEVRQNGVRVFTQQRQYVIDCRTGMTCTVDGGIAFLSSSGGGGGSTPTVSCTIDQALTWDGVNWACISKIRAAYMADAGTFALVATTARSAYEADASVFAVVATTANVAYSADASYLSSVANVSATAYSSDASYTSVVSGTANVAYSADASYLSSVATVARSAYEADASVFAVVATTAQVAYSADASYSAQIATTAQVAYSADASYSAQLAGTANVAYSADASYLSSIATVARSAYEADASVFTKQFITDPTDCAGGQFATAIDVLGNLTCATPSGSGGKVAEAYMADASISAQYLTLTCGGGQFVTCAGTSCSCATPSGGGGSSNFSAGTAVFAGKSDALTTVTAAWATSSSAILCTADGEEASVEGLTTVVKSKAAGSFVVRSYVTLGTHTGNLPFTCTGL